MGADAALRPFAQQYLALSHLFLAFHAHASQPPTPALQESVVSSARAAINILRTSVDSELPLSPSAVLAKRTSPAVARTAPSAPAASPLKPEPATATATRTRRPTRAAATPARTTRTLSASTRRAAPAAPAPPPPPAQVTPPRKTRGRVELKESTRTPVKGPETGKLLLDDVDHVFALLGASSSRPSRTLPAGEC